jgi:arginine repressor
MLHRTYANLVLATDAHGEDREAARELLRQNPKIQGTEVVKTLESRGLQISRASVSRLRADVKPRTQTRR